MKRRGPFRTLGMRMQDFGRNLMRRYVPPQNAPVGRSIAPPPPAWQSDTQTPLIWNEPQAILPPPVENLPFETSVVEAPPAASPPISPPPVRQSRPAAPVAQRKADDSENKIDPRLLAILGAHQEREAQAARIREERHAAATASELQRQVDESQPGAPPPRRRNRASFDYVETKALMPLDEEPGFTPLPKTPAETIQAERQPDQPKDDDDAEESRAAETETVSPEANIAPSSATALGDEFTDAVDLSSRPVSAAPPSIQRTSEAESSSSLPVADDNFPDSGEIEPSYTAPVSPETVTPVRPIPRGEPVPGSETTVQRSPESAPPIPQSMTGKREAPTSGAIVQPTIQRKLEAPQTEQPAESLSDEESESPDESGLSPAVSRQSGEAVSPLGDLNAGEVSKAEPSRPTVQRQIEAPKLFDNIVGSQSAVEVRSENQASSAPISEQSRDIPAQVESLSDAPAVVQRQVEAPSEELTGWTENEPHVVPIENVSEQVQQVPTGVNEPPQASAERPIIQRQDDAAEASTSEAAQPTVERPVVQRQAEQAADTFTDNPVQSIPERPIVQRQIKVPSDDVTAIEPNAEPIERVSQQAEPAPSGVNKPSPPAHEHPMIQRQAEQPISAEPIQADVQHNAVGDEIASLDIEPEFPADVEAIHDTISERPLAQRQIAQPAANEQGKMEASEATYDLPVSQPSEQIPTLGEIESRADIPAKPSAAKAPLSNKPDVPIQRTLAPAAQAALPRQEAEVSQSVGASDTFSEAAAEEAGQEVEQPDGFEALIAAGMVSVPPESRTAPGQASTIRRESAAPEEAAESNYPLPFDSEESFAPDMDSEQAVQQPLNVFEALVEAGMVAPESRQGRAEIARKAAPSPESSAPPVSRERPASSSSFPDSIPVQYASAPQVVMRVETDDSAPQQGGESNVDVDKLARDVYSVLRHRLRVDKERRG